MNISELFQSNLVVALIALVVGSALTAFTGKLQSKTSTLRYSCRVDRVAVSANDQLFGAVNVTWQGTAVRNLYTAVVEVENTTSRDFENVPFKIYIGDATVLLGERTAVLDSPYIVTWSDTFKSQLSVTTGATPTQQQWNIYNHSREYTIPVFNRRQRLQFTYLCTCPGTDEPPGIFVSTLYPGMKLKRRNFAPLVLGVPVHVAAPRGLLVTVLAVILCGVFVGNSWIAAVIPAVVGLTAQIYGAWLYKAERWLVRAVSG